MSHYFTLSNTEQTLPITASIVLGVDEALQLDSRLPLLKTLLNPKSKSRLSQFIKHMGFKGSIGECFTLVERLSKEQTVVLVVVGIGSAEERTTVKAAQIYQKAIQALLKTPCESVLNTLSELQVKDQDPVFSLRQLSQLHETLAFRFELYKSKKSPERTLNHVRFSLPHGLDSGLAEIEINNMVAIAEGMNFTRFLANQPANVCTPTYLAEQAQQMAEQDKRFASEIFDGQAIKALNMHAFSAVAQGSVEDPKMVVLHYHGNEQAKNSQPIVLVGKGITFDSGGISIKPSEKMDEMKFDMCGAAAVLGCLKAVARLGLGCHLIGILACAENLPDGGAVKPGDIVTSRSGKSIEILNTDAEGRLVLCDVLDYCKTLSPQAVIDIATLTGAVVVGLGNHPVGLLSNHQALADKLLEAGRKVHDRAWQLPLWEDYKAHIETPFADIANISTIGGGGGAITAATFLAHFTETFHWAHLDIAGTAWKTGKEKGATGRPVALLTQYLIDTVKQKT